LASSESVGDAGQRIVPGENHRALLVVEGRELLSCGGSRRHRPSPNETTMLTIRSTVRRDRDGQHPLGLASLVRPVPPRPPERSARERRERDVSHRFPLQNRQIPGTGDEARLAGESIV
jgi:hypothetical protein